MKNLSFTEKAQISRLIILALLSTLMLYYIVTHTLNGVDILFRSVVSVIPLIIFVPGILSRKYRSASLLCFVLLLYFMLAVQSLFMPGGTLAEVFVLTVIVLLFTVAMFYSRWQQRADVFENNPH